VKDQILLVTGLDHRRDDVWGNAHPRSSSTFLSSAPLNRPDAQGFSTDVTVDQIAAQKLGRETFLPSLELGLFRLGRHTSNISWRAPGSPTGVETNPRSIFRRLFGDPRGDAERRSLLDLVQDDARLLRSKLGRRDQE